MKKSIGMKEIMAAHKEVEDAVSSFNYQADLLRKQSRFGDEKKKDDASRRVDAARLNFNAVSAPLSVAIEEAEGRARVRTIRADEIANELAGIESALRIPKKYLEGISVSVDLNAQGFPKAYMTASKMPPQSTIFYAVYKSGSWRVVDICRGNCRPSSRKTEVILTDEAKKAIVARFERGEF